MNTFLAPESLGGESLADSSCLGESGRGEDVDWVFDGLDDIVIVNSGTFLGVLGGDGGGSVGTIMSICVKLEGREGNGLLGTTGFSVEFPVKL